MIILAVETATEACSAALDINDDCRVRFEVAPGKHTELILPMVNELLQEANISVVNLDAIAFGQGPGAFTGVRIATGLIQGLAFAYDLPVIPVSTLAALAQTFIDRHECIATAIDARMQEVYWGLYKKNELGLMEKIVEDSVCAPANIKMVTENDWFGVGTGWKAYPHELKTRFQDNFIGADYSALPSAEGVIQLAKSAYFEGRIISVEEAIPVYLRDKVAKKQG